MHDTARRRLVTDAPIRVFHVLFATGFAAAWLTGDADDWRALHVALGYALAGLLGWRLVYGLIGPRQARLGAMARRAAGLLPWLKALPARLRGEGAPGPVHWAQGASLLMALLPLALMAGLPLLALSGLATYQDWGGLGEASEELHEGLANALGLIAIAHPLMVIAISLLRRRNLAAPMWSGRIAGVGPDLVRHERRLWALLLAINTLMAAGTLWREELRKPSRSADATELNGGQIEGDDEEDRPAISRVSEASWANRPS
jgi:cytochrome b